jgi:hypothetical protein
MAIAIDAKLAATPGVTAGDVSTAVAAMVAVRALYKTSVTKAL